MRLGGFWGMTAPVLLLAFHDIGEIKSLISSMQRTVNTDILDDLKTEFYVLSKVSDFTVVDTGLNDANAIFIRKANTCTFENGHLMVDGAISQQDAEFTGELTRLLAEMIIKGEQKGKFVNLDGNDDIVLTLRLCVTRWFKDKSFSLLKTKQMVRALYRSIATAKTCLNSAKIIEAFGFKRVIPDSIMLNGEVVKINASVKAVCSYYVNRLDDIHELLHFITSDPMREEKILDISFFDLIKRKPISFFYIVLSKFEIAKYKPSANLIRNTVDTVWDGVNLYKECINKHVKVYGESESIDTMTYEFFAELQSAFSKEKRLFFTGIQYADFTSEDFAQLSLIYDRVSVLSADYFNHEFGLHLSKEEWLSVFKEVCDLCVYGLNFHTLALFKSSIDTTTLTFADNVKKDKEYMDSLYKVLDDVESLLSTMRPIGEVL
ncbi:hypothetical protein AALB53_08385 [Lachnospiraceae bacterium 47-T17]